MNNICVKHVSSLGCFDVWGLTDPREAPSPRASAPLENEGPRAPVMCAPPTQAHTRPQLFLSSHTRGHYSSAPNVPKAIYQLGPFLMPQSPLESLELASPRPADTALPTETTVKLLVHSLLTNPGDSLCSPAWRGTPASLGNCEQQTAPSEVPSPDLAASPHLNNSKTYI